MYDPFSLISRLNTALPWVKNLKLFSRLFVRLKKTFFKEEMFRNILDEKEFLDNKKIDFTYTVVAILD